MKKIYSTPDAKLSILCNEDIMSTSPADTLTFAQDGLGTEIDFNDFIK